MGCIPMWKKSVCIGRKITYWSYCEALCGPNEKIYFAGIIGMQGIDIIGRYSIIISRMKRELVTHGMHIRIVLWNEMGIITGLLYLMGTRWSESVMGPVRGHAVLTHMQQLAALEHFVECGEQAGLGWFLGSAGR